MNPVTEPFERAPRNPDPGAGRIDPYALGEIAGSRLFAHPRVAALSNESIGRFRPLLAGIEASIPKTVPGSVDTTLAECVVSLMGGCAAVRLAPHLTDIDTVVHVAFRSGAPISSQEAAKDTLAQSSAASLVALVESLASRPVEPMLEFVNVETSIPVNVPEAPGRTGGFVANWSREDLVIGSTLASLGTVPLKDVFLRGGNAVVSLATDFDGLRTVLDLRFEPVILSEAASGRRLASPGVCHWLGRVWGSEESAKRAVRLEQEIARTLPGYDPAAASIRIIDRNAAEALTVGGRAAKALKQAVLALGLLGEIERAEALASPLRSWMGEAASIAGRLALLVKHARGHWSDHGVLAEEAALLRARLNSVSTAGAAENDLNRLRATTDLWDSSADSGPDDPRRWSGLHRVARTLAECSDLPALGWLRGHADLVAPLPMLSGAIRAAAK